MRRACDINIHIYFSYLLQDGRLEAGDQILSVNENGLVDVTQTQ